MTITLNVHYFPTQYSPVVLYNNEGTLHAVCGMKRLKK